MTVNSARKHPRYTVSHYERLSADLESGSGRVHLTTLSQSGAGFYSFAELPETGTGSELTLWLTLQHVVVRLEVKARVVFARPIKLGEKQVHYYGIEFAAEHRSRLAPVLDEVERELGGYRTAVPAYSATKP